MSPDHLDPGRASSGVRSSGVMAALLEPLHALQAGDVEQHTAASDALGHLDDYTCAMDVVRRRVAVGGASRREDVRPARPLRRRLQWHEDVVIGVVEAPGIQSVPVSDTSNTGLMRAPPGTGAA
jgi:hypothetical protein